MKKILLVCASLFLALSVFAQDRVVTGKVTSAEDGGPLPGVNVIVKGTSTGTVTDTDGKYSISVSGNDAVLTFTFVGLRSEEAIVGDRAVVDTQLASDVSQLSEVVVTGYGGTQERRDLTGSIASVKGSDISNLATSSFDQQLAGRAAGLQVSTPSGVIGQAPVIRIRGISSIGNSSDPLVVIDNLPVTTGSTSGAVSNNALGDINPNDIESMEVLKDGAATAIYGSRASGGVILITTKKGKKGKVQVDYDAYAGVNTTFRRYKVLDGSDFETINNEKITNAGGSPAAFPLANPVSTDWQKLVFRTGSVQSHALSLRGATDKTTYFFSLGFMDQKGALKNNEQKRVNMRFNVDHKIFDWLSFGTDMGLTRTETIGLNTGGGALSGNVFNAVLQTPNVSPYNADGSYNLNGPALGDGNNTLPNGFKLPNIQYVIDHNKFKGTNYRVIGNVHAQATFLKDFVVRTQLGIDGLFTDDYAYLDAGQGDGFPAGIVFQQHSPTLTWDWQNTIIYNRTLAENHKIQVVAGTEDIKTTFSSFSGTGNGLSNPYFGQYNIISNTLGTQNINGDYQQRGIHSLFARANYAFKDKYLVSGSIRTDQNSAFLKQNNKGTFTGGSIGWRLSNEEFFKSLTFLSSVSDLKFRASYAQVGNANVGNFPAYALYSPALYGNQSGLEYNAPGNQALKWETSKKLDIGVDLALFDNKIVFNADYFQNKNDNLILQSPTAPSLGIPQNFINKNVGAMTNKGLELTVSAAIITRQKFSWNLSANFTSMHNKVTALDKSGDINSTYQVTRVGQSIGSFLGYQYEGVNKANGNPLYQIADGSIIQGNIDDQSYYAYDPANPATLGAPVAALSTTKDRKILGPSTPTWFGGLNNTFRYGNFDLGVLARFSGGNKVLNLTRQTLLGQGFNNNSKEILGRWQSEANPGDGVTPKLSYGNDNFVNLTNATSTRFLESGNFLRIQNVSLGYTLPSAILQRAKITKLRIYAQVQNLALITKYKGIDPESNSNPGSNNNSGQDNSVNPQLRSWSLGLNLGF